MQDKFVGDIGDYGKYRLLRALCGDSLRLGVVWCFVRDRMIDYLADSGRFETCDPELFDILKSTVESCTRKVASVEASGLFPKGTVFFPQEVPQQAAERREWEERALEEAGRCEVVFFDPDNGLRRGSLPNRGVSSKHIYHSELRPFVERGQSVVVIHHASRRGRFDSEIQTVLGDLADISRSQPCSDPFALRYHRGAPPRAFFVLPAKKREGILLSRAVRLTSDSKRWGRHFTLHRACGEGVL